MHGHLNIKFFKLKYKWGIAEFSLDYILIKLNIGGPPYPRVIRSKTYRVYMKPRIIPNAVYDVIFVWHTQIGKV